jgi:hypothetical protein
MTDEELAGLFAEGTAPDRDAAFARRVDARIGFARARPRLLAPGLRALVILSLAAAVFVTVRTLEPALLQIVDHSPQFMGVSVPTIMAVLAVGLAVRALRFLRLRLG